MIAGLYGKLTINPDGSYSYDLDDSEPDVIALDEGETLQDVFTYTVSDKDGEHEKSSYSTLTITICGANDGPTAKADTNMVTELEGNIDTSANDIAGNVLQNLDHDGDANPEVGPFNDDADTDPDGDTLCVVEIGRSAGPDGPTAIWSLTCRRDGGDRAGRMIAGEYGKLTINPDGSYSYDLDDSNPDC